MKKIVLIILASLSLAACVPWDGGRIHDPALYPGPAYRAGEAEWDREYPGGVSELMATEAWVDE